MLADGSRHSGNDLAEALGVSRAAIWKQLEALRELGLTIDGEAGQGYQLQQTYEALDAAKIRRSFSDTSALRSLDLFWEIDSTNDYLRSKSDLLPGVADVCVADYQTGGRGRRGRRWVSPPGCGIWLSVAWSWEAPPRDLPALSLAVGTAVLKVLQAAGLKDASMKWPNDIYAGDSKLAGILIDVQGDAAGPIGVVVGLGLNLEVTDSARKQVREDGGLPPVGLYELGVSAGRNQLLGELLNGIVQTLSGYAAGGFAPLREYWCKHDYLRGKDVEVSGREQKSGIASGVNDGGYLLLDTGGRQELIAAGDVSVRGVRG